MEALESAIGNIEIGGAGGGRRVIFVGGVAGVYFSNTGLEKILFPVFVRAISPAVSFNLSSISVSVAECDRHRVSRHSVALAGTTIARMSIIAKHICRRYLA